MSQYISPDKLTYCIYSPVTKDRSCQPVFNRLKRTELNEQYTIFDETIIEKILQGVSFEFGGEKLSEAKLKLREIILKLLSEKGKSVQNIPPNYVNREILGKDTRLNLRDNVDEKLFWHSGVYHIMEHAVRNNYNLRFIYSDGSQPFDPDIKLEK